PTGARRVPASRYTDPRFLALEAERLWPRVWLCAAHASELDAPGSFVTFDLGRESFLITRSPGASDGGGANENGGGASANGVGAIGGLLAPVASIPAPCRPGEMAIRGAATVEIACNWKLSADVSNEAYHLRSLHPELLQLLDDTSVRLSMHGPHSRYVIPFGA